LDEDTERALALARARTAAAAREHLRELEPTFSTPAEWEIAGRLQAAYDDREAHFRAHAEGAAPDDDARQHEIEQRLRGEAHGAERRALLELRRSGEIGDDVYRSIEWDLDLAESRLTS
jgi:phage shock protein A